MAGLSLFRRVIRNEDFNRVLGVEPFRPRPLGQKLLCKAVWFWPRIEDARGWAEASTGTQWNPEQYLHSHRTKLVEQVLQHTTTDDSLMELGCNCGSDMAQLYDLGYRNLRGVDASGAALDLFGREYPAVFRHCNIQHDLFQRYLMNSGDDEVEFIYSNGATIELVHPSFPVVAEICRVARSGVLLDLSEQSQGYPRDYVGLFRNSGFNLVYSNKPEVPNSKSHIFVFTRR